MHYPVIIYSADHARGGILKKLLSMNKLHSLLFDKVLDVKKQVVREEPEILFLDLGRSINAEVGFLADLVQGLGHGDVMISGMPADYSLFYSPGGRVRILFQDTFDPENILKKTKKILKLKSDQENCDKTMIETSLKEFLKLE